MSETGELSWTSYTRCLTRHSKEYCFFKWRHSCRSYSCVPLMVLYDGLNVISSSLKPWKAVWHLIANSLSWINYLVFQQQYLCVLNSEFFSWRFWEVERKRSKWPILRRTREKESQIDKLAERGILMLLLQGPCCMDTSLDSKRNRSFCRIFFWVIQAKQQDKIKKKIWVMCYHTL